jgi:hypothetical protein
MKNARIIALTSIGLLLLAACTGGLPAGQSDTDSNVVEPPPAPSATPTATKPSSPDSDSMQDSGDEASPPEPSATPTVRPGLEATDPESVNLASGKPTLLEFFAFW